MALVLAGCAGPRGASSAGPPTANQAGCSSGYSAAGNPYYSFKKDVPRYISDPVYKVEWDDGFALCKGRYEAIR